MSVIYKHTYNIGRYIEHADRARAWSQDFAGAAKMPQLRPKGSQSVSLAAGKTSVQWPQPDFGPRTG
jgi:hypothetical protein